MVRTGRPKKSSNVACVCKQCGKAYEVPEWQRTGREYCSRECFHASRVGKPGPVTPIEPTVKVCPRCGKQFLVGGRGRPPQRTMYCSQTCAAAAMGHHPAPLSLTDVQVAWLAGLFDGEGSIVFPRKGNLNCRISITNTHYPLLERVLEVTGTGVLIKRTMLSEKHSQSWEWQCYSTNARNLLRQMLPWLIVKKEKALIALSKE